VTGPWTIDQARQAANLASAQQKGAESMMKDAGRAYAEAERAYRILLAQTITRLKAEGVAWSSTADLARGDKAVADLKLKRDVAEAVYETTKAALWRHSGDRRDVHQFAGWSMRAGLRDDADAGASHDWDGEPSIGARS